ncbi:MAG: DNA/RNA non-specific endonuclease [Kofleriaceae bacterium]
MRLLPIALAVALATACGGNSSPQLPDASIGSDAPVAPDAAPPSGDGIAEARAAADGTDVSLIIHGVTVTYLKPLIGTEPADPAGFTIQAAKLGPALFVAVDPATLTPPAQVGDVVDFTITSKKTVAQQPRALAIVRYAQTATGADVGALAQDLTGAADVVSALDSYESELVSLTGTIVQDPSAGGTGFQRAAISTTGLPGDANFQIRAPEDVFDAIDMAKTCQLTVTHVPMGRFNAQAQLAAFSASEISIHGCPAPVIVNAVATSATTLQLTFSRNILASSVLSNGSQFTFDNGLTASAAAVGGRAITLTTTAQALATTYLATIAASVTDLQGSSVGAPGTASFVGFDNTSEGAGARLSRHTTMGIPSPTSAGDPNNFLSVKDEYVISYNASHKVPNWVSWELNTSYLGGTDRQNDFRPDDTFPGSEMQAALTDYSGSGYDRGHMCPSADRTLSTLTNSHTFYLTNMVPQAANNNQGPWAVLENDSRTLVRAGKELFIISGGTFSDSSNKVGSGVVVPDMTFKVIVVLDSVGQGTANVTTSTRVIAVLMPNENALISRGADWKTFRVSVDTIEAMTGYNFLSDVPTAIQDVIEARVDNL